MTIADVLNLPKFSPEAVRFRLQNRCSKPDPIGSDHMTVIYKPSKETASLSDGQVFNAEQLMKDQTTAQTSAGEHPTRDSDAEAGERPVHGGEARERTVRANGAAWPRLISFTELLR